MPETKEPTIDLTLQVREEPASLDDQRAALVAMYKTFFSGTHAQLMRRVFEVLGLDPKGVTGPCGSLS